MNIVKISKKNIEINFPDLLIEDKISLIKDELEKSNFESSGNDLKDKELIFDFSLIKRIDFFGYQFLFLYVKYLLRIVKETGIREYKIKNKSKILVNFENKLGLPHIEDLLQE